MNRRDFIGAIGTAVPGAAAQLVTGLTPPMQRARDAALEVLKPSPRELERGLALHAESVVIEPYGFSPRSAQDGDAIRAAFDAGASEIELQDMLEEMMMTRCVTDEAERQEYMRAWDVSGVTCVFQNAGEEGQDPLRLMKRLSRFTYVTDYLGGFVRRGIDAGDIEAAKRDRRHCLFFTTNGVPLVQQWVSVQDELRYIRIFHQFGVRMMHLTYNRRNMIGDGCAEPSNAGLSDFGRAVIAEMNRVGVIVDVAHSGWRTSLEAARTSKAPVVASHTACAALNEHIRSKPDDVIRAIVDTGGLIGICSVPDFIAGDIRAMLNHLEYAIKKFGAEHVAIATDVAAQSVNADREWQKMPRRPRSRTAWEYFWPRPLNQNPAAARTMAWTNWPLFTVGLVQRGFTDDQIRNVIGGNVLRLVKSVLPARIRG